MTSLEFQEKNPTKEEKEIAIRDMSDEQIDELISTAGIVQAKIAYSRLKKKNQIRRYSKRYNEIASKAIGFLSASDTENIVLSPFSILMLLSVAADAVNGKTRQEIMDAIDCDLDYESYRNMVSEIQRLITEVITHVDGDHEYTTGGQVVSANAVCIKENIKKSINPEYENRLEKYHGELFSSQNIVKDVNSWVSEKTGGMIKQIADDSVKRMVACLMNAITFGSEWEDDYDEDDIVEDIFNNADGSVSNVQMLESWEDSYVENDLFTGFVRPYKGKEYSYMALLPKKEGIDAMKYATESLNLSDIFWSATNSRVVATMPEFKCDFRSDLTSLCKEMGINTIFSPQADFSPMSSEWLKMEAIIHKAYIQVDREGTKAAAASIGVVYCGCAPVLDEPKTVKLDRPFVYAIIHNETGLPVFAGITNSVS